jgi:hypothetical protein
MTESLPLTPQPAKQAPVRKQRAKAMTIAAATSGRALKRAQPGLQEELRTLVEVTSNSLRPKEGMGPQASL